MSEQQPFSKIINPQLEADGLPLDSVVYVAGHQFVPASEEDEHLYRRLYIVGKVEDNGAIGSPKLVQGTSLETLGDDKQKELIALCEAYVSPQEV